MTTANRRQQDAIIDGPMPTTPEDAMEAMTQVCFLSMKEKYRLGMPVASILSMDQYLAEHLEIMSEDGRVVPDGQLAVVALMFNGAKQRFEQWLND